MVGKIVLYALTIGVLLGGIGYIFYLEEFQYAQATPIPENYKSVNIGDSIAIDLPGLSGNKAVFIHFFNNDCPCSRFNIDEFKQMVYRYKEDISFLAIIQGDETEKEAVDKFKSKYDLGIPTMFDQNGKIAYELGVISTPQAVIVDQNHKIYYKGNYNKARFCTAKNTQFADMALRSFIENKPPPKLSLLASVPYGCALPGNKELSKNIITELFKQ